MPCARGRHVCGAVELQFPPCVVVCRAELDGQRQLAQRGGVATDVHMPAEILPGAVAGELQGFDEADQLESIGGVDLAENTAQPVVQPLAVLRRLDPGNVAHPVVARGQVATIIHRRRRLHPCLPQRGDCRALRGRKHAGEDLRISDGAAAFERVRMGKRVAPAPVKHQVADAVDLGRVRKKIKQVHTRAFWQGKLAGRRGPTGKVGIIPALPAYWAKKVAKPL